MKISDQPHDDSAWHPGCLSCVKNLGTPSFALDSRVITQVMALSQETATLREIAIQLDTGSEQDANRAGIDWLLAKADEKQGFLLALINAMAKAEK